MSLATTFGRALEFEDRVTSKYVFILVLSAVVFSLYGLHLPFERDNSIYLYMGQQVLDGVAPYVSLYELKTPLSSFVIAFALRISDLLGADPIIGMRVIFMLISAGTLVALYQLARRLFSETDLPILAPITMIGFHGFVLQTAEGARPKILVLLFFVLAILFILNKRWFLAGLFSSLAAFTWQPAVIVAAVTFFYAVLQRRGAWFKAVVMMALGFAIPAVAIAAYFAWKGALYEFFEGMVLVHFYNEKPNQNEIYNIGKSIILGFPLSSVLILASLPVFLLYSLREIFVSGLSKLGDNPYVPLALILCLFGLASILDFQAYADFYPFLPIAALGVVVIYKLLMSLVLSRNWLTPARRPLVGLIVGLVLVLIPFLNAAFATDIHPLTAIWRNALSEQKQAYARVLDPARAQCAPNCKIFVLGLPEMTALLEFQNLSRYSVINFRGTDAFIASHYDNGFAGWIEEMEAKRPDIVVIKMTVLGQYRDENQKALLAWLNSDKFRKLSHDEAAVRSKKFRSSEIQTWVRNHP